MSYPKEWLKDMIPRALTTCWADERKCPECGAVVNRSTRYRWCANPKCGWAEKVVTE